MDASRCVEEVMTCPVVAVRPGVAVDEIARQLVGRGIGAVPVVDEALRVVGVVAEADVLMDDRPGRAVARDVMSAPALTITVDTTVGVARALLSTHRIGRLPVVDHQGRLVGIVCRRDLLVSDLSADARIKWQAVERVAGLAAANGTAPVEQGHLRDTRGDAT
jgi:CBS-domain-containing membrane protein